MIEVDIGEIIVQDRIRQNNGFLDSLERSIQQVGVLQPIGITLDKHLIFGGRRLQASKNVGLKTIPVRVFDIAADDPITALRMEREENEHRMDLTPSEKVEVAKRIEEAVGNRQGQRTDIKPESGKKELMPTLAQVEPGTKTREIAAQSVDMKPETYRKAKAVVDSGDDELIHQMDTGEKSIHAAYKAIPKSEPEPTKTPPAPRAIATPEQSIPKENNPNKQKLATALNELTAFKKKYHDVVELSKIFRVIDEVIDGQLTN